MGSSEEEEDGGGDCSDAVMATAAESDGNGDGDGEDHGFFREGEKVLAYHGPLIYEAKVTFLPFRLLPPHLSLSLSLSSS